MINSTERTRRLNRDRIWGLVDPTLRDQEGPEPWRSPRQIRSPARYHQAHSAWKRRKRRIMKQFFNAFNKATRTKNRSWKLDGVNSAGDLTNSHLKTIRTRLITKIEHEERENLGVGVQILHGPTRPMRQRPDYAEAARIKNRLRREAGDWKAVDTSQQTSTSTSKWTIYAISPKNQNIRLIPRPDGDGILHLRLQVRHGGDERGGLPLSWRERWV